MRTQIDLDDLSGFALTDDLGISRAEVTSHADLIAHVDDSRACKHRDFHDVLGHTNCAEGMSDYFCARPAGTLCFQEGVFGGCALRQACRTKPLLRYIRWSAHFLKASGSIFSLRSSAAGTTRRIQG